MKIILFGATGMVGQAVLRECLLDPRVTQVVAVGRGGLAQRDAKLREVVLADMSDYSGITGDLRGADACFFCLGVSSAGMKEEDYRRVTYDLTLAAATALARINPGMIFTYVSGAGTDSTGTGERMWARVKGATENALLALPLKAYMFRPGVIRPMHGIKPKSSVYRAFYVVASPLIPLIEAFAPNLMTTSEQVGRAMLRVAKAAPAKRILETADIRAMGSPASEGIFQ